jgi:hypothetical protein
MRLRIVRTLALGLPAAAAVLAAQTVHPIPKGPNTLAGRVVNIESDAPIGGAVVTITGYLDAAGKPTDPQRVTGRPGETSAPRAVMTTPDGHFIFRDLPAGTYALAATAFGYMRSDYPPRVVELHDNAKPALASLRLWQHGAISGVVTDTQGEPVAGVPVYAMRRAMVGGRLVLRREWIDSVTDDRGVYRIAPLPPGRYVVGVLAASMSLPADLAADVDAGATRTAVSSLRSRLTTSGAQLQTGQGVRMGDLVLQRPGSAPTLAPDGRPLMHATAFFPGTANAAEATVVSIGSGESRTGVDIGIRFAPAMRLSGVALGPDGPMPHMKIRLLPAGVVEPDLFDTGAVEAVTSSAGAFTFAGVPPGSYVLSAALTAFATPTSPEVSLWAAQPIAVGERDIGGVTVTLRPGIRVSGRVEFRGATSMPSSSTQRISVSLRPVTAESWRTLPGYAGADGTFTTPGDPPGRYEVYGYAPGGWNLIAVSRAGQPVAERVITLGDEAIADLVLTFSNTPTRLSGSVADAKGAPDPDADVIVFPADTSVWREGIFDSRRVRQVHATGAGAFDVAALSPGEYHVVAVSSRLTMNWDDPVFLEQLIPGAMTVALGDGAHETLALKTFVPRGR